MAITSLDGIISGALPPLAFLKNGATMEAAGQMHTFFYVGGWPGAATANAAGMSGAAVTTNTSAPTTGHLPFTNPGSGNTYLTRLEAACTVVGRLVLIDRLWHQSGIAVTTTTGQTINSVTWPARDLDGATSGRGVMVAIEVSSATGNGGATAPTITYTNSGGTGSRTGTIAAFPATAATGTFQPFGLNAGDVGIQSVQTVTLNTSLVSGTIHLVAYRELAAINIVQANVGAALDAVALGLPRLYDNTSLQLCFIPSATTACTLMGGLSYAQG